MDDRVAPRNIRGLVGSLDMAVYLGVSDSTIRNWRLRKQKWVEAGRPKTRAVPAIFPDPVPDPADPEQPFILNRDRVWDVVDVVRFKRELESRKGISGEE